MHFVYTKLSDKYAGIAFINSVPRGTYDAIILDAFDPIGKHINSCVNLNLLAAIVRKEHAPFRFDVKKFNLMQDQLHKCLRMKDS